MTTTTSTNAADFIWIHWFSCCSASEQNPPNHRIRIDRSMISDPMNFQHTVHIGSQGAQLQNGQLKILQRQLCSKGGYSNLNLSGGSDESAPCYILQVDDVRIMLDCGWNERFDMDLIRDLKRHINQLDAVLISHPDALHLGALPYLVGKMNLSCPIYATVPVYKMGQMFMYDLYLSHFNVEDFNLFDLDDVDAAFDKMVQLKYNQSVALKGKGFGITVTPLPAGHMIGGTIWKITKIGEEEIIYANDFNHKKERHLNGCEIETINRPSLLIIDSYNALYKQTRRRTRDEKLMTSILQSLRNNGNVLIAVDTAGRVLELAHMLDQVWRNKESGLFTYPIVFLNNVAYNVVEFAKSQMEWMSEKLMRTFEGFRNNPFQFKHIKLCHSLMELAKFSSPKVVLASFPDMECGFSRDLFFQWSSNPANCIIFTRKTSLGTLARDLIDNGGNRTLELIIKKKVALEGAELEEYLRTQRDLNHNNDKMNEDRIDSDSDDELEMSIVCKGKHDYVIKQENKASSFFKATKKQHPMYPLHEDKIKCDDYGEIIKLEEFKFGESIMEVVDENKENCIQMDDNKNNSYMDDNNEVPTKSVTQYRSANVNCQIQYIDFEGRSDGESLLKLIAQIKAHRIITVRGSGECAAAISNALSSMPDVRVFAPNRGDVVNVTTENYIYQVRLTDSMLSQLNFQKCKGAELTWIDAEISVKEPGSDIQKSNGETEETVENRMEEEKVLTLESVTNQNSHRYSNVFINQFKLADFKQILLKNEIESDFVGGTLMCKDGSLAIRKMENGKIVLEGCMSDNYYKVRSLLYAQFAVL